MKTQLLSQIRAKIGRCHLHSKKKSSYSITLKMGSKAVVSTQYKIPKNQQIDFNCELSLQIDRHLVEGPGKLSIIVNMLTEEKQKKVVGSVFANLKQSGMFGYKVSQCSCKDKAFEVEIAFQVVNIQNLNNNHNNNKFHSPNQSQMKDLKNALTVSRQKQVAKNFKGKKQIAAKSPIQKTQARVKTSRNQKQFESEISMSPNQSQLTKIFPSKQSDQSKQIMNNLKDQIKKLESKLKLTKEQLNEKQKYEKGINKQMDYMQRSLQQIRNQNICLLEMLKIQEQKNSAAIQYIQFMANFTKRGLFQKTDQDIYMKLMKNIGQKSTNSGFYQQQLQISIRESRQYSFGNKTIQEKDEYLQINGELTQQLVIYKSDNVNLKRQLQQLAIFTQIKNSQFQQFKTRFLKIQLQKRQLSEDCEDHLKQLQKLKNQNSLLRNDLLKVNQILIERQNQKKQLQNQLSSLKKQLSKKAQQVISQNKQLSEAVEKFLNLQRILNNSKDQIAQFKRALKDNQTENKKLNQQLQKYKSKNNQKNYKVQFPANIQDKTQIQDNIRHIQMLIPDSSNTEIATSRKSGFEDAHSFQENKSLLSQLEQVSNIMPQQNYNTQNQHKQKLKLAKQRSTEAQSEADDVSGTVVQRYNYNYDVDSVNYFNNFNDNHVDIQDSLVDNGQLDQASREHCD